MLPYHKLLKHMQQVATKLKTKKFCDI